MDITAIAIMFSTHARTHRQTDIQGKKPISEP